MKNHSSLCVLAFLIFLASCGKSSPSRGKRVTRISPQEIQTILDNQIFECAGIDGGSCPEGVSRVLVINPSDSNQSGVCTGFMVNSKTLVTNHHCVETQSICDSTYIAVYQGSTYHQTRCRRVIKSEEDFADAGDPRRKVDYAVLEVENEYFGGTFNLAEETAIEAEEVTAWVMDHTGLDNPEARNLFESRVTEFRCKANRGATFSESLILENCPIIEGNSGSPALNSQGQVVGIIWGGNRDTVNTTQTPLEDRRSAAGDIGAVSEMTFFKPWIPLMP